MAPADLREFFTTYYRPDRAVIAVVGDVDPARFLALVRRDFGSWKGGPAPRPMATVEPEQRGERRATEYMQSNPLVAMAWPVPTWGHPDKVAIEATARILGRGDSSRLHTALVKRDRIAFQASAFAEYPGARYPHLFALFGAPQAPHTADEVEEALVREAYRLKDEPVTPREMEKTISMMEADILRQLSENWWLPNSLAGTQVVTGDWRNLLYMVEQIRALSPDDIRRVANEYLLPRRRTVVQVLPKPS
jgi:predicted Zn-dependent peptidase